MKKLLHLIEEERRGERRGREGRRGTGREGKGRRLEAKRGEISPRILSSDPFPSVTPPTSQSFYGHVTNLRLFLQNMSLWGTFPSPSPHGLWSELGRKEEESNAHKRSCAKVYG